MALDHRCKGVVGGEHDYACSDSPRLRGRTCDIFIRSYYKDFPWLVYCLKSIERFCSGFRDVIVVVPRSSRSRIERIGFAARNLHIAVCDDYRDDYLGQQVTKLHADRFTDADLVCHVDSDCVFARPITPDDLVAESKVCIAMRPIASLGRHRPWVHSTEEFLGWPVAYDFMHHPPFTFPRGMYVEIRQHAIDVHSMDLARYITGRPPRGFSEFNVLGAFAYVHHRDCFTWINVNAGMMPVPMCRWYWSWGGLTPEIRQEIDALLAE